MSENKFPVINALYQSAVNNNQKKSRSRPSPLMDGYEYDPNVSKYPYRKGTRSTIAKSDDYFDQNPPLHVPSNVRELTQKYKIDGDEKFPIEMGKNSESGKFVSPTQARLPAGKAAAYAISKGDYFAGITFLSEGITSRAFYHDPASGGNKGVLINTHPGITLSMQTPSTIRKIFANTSIAHLSEEIVDKALGRNRGISANMRNVSLKVSDYYNMFNIIEGTYSQGVVNALKKRFNGHPLAKQMLNSGHSSHDVLKTIQKQLPPASYSVLQQLSYKYGVAGINRFGKLLDSAISAALDPDNQNKHLMNGARHIVYQYMNGKKQWIQDTRVMNIHRLFYTSGQRFSPELNIKLIQGGKLSAAEEELVGDVAKKAGVPSIIKDGKLSLPDATKDTIRQSNSDKLKFNESAINKGVSNVNQNFKPVNVEVKKTTNVTVIDHTPKVPTPKPKAPKPKKPAASSCMVAECLL